MDEEVLGALTWAQACHAVQQTFRRSSYSANLVNRLSVITNVLIGTLSRMPLWRTLTFRFPEEERPLAIVTLQRVGIADWAFQRAANLSGGEQQRAAITRAMVQRAQLVLADEPIASLDPEAARRVMESLAELNHIDGVTVLVSLHQVQFAMPAGAQWAEPDIGHAADCLRLLAGDAGLRSRLRTKARERAERQFSLDRFREVAAGLLPAPASIQRV